MSEPVETLSGDPDLELPEFDQPPPEPLALLERWGGWRLDPDLIEFWHGSPSRLHRRLLYIKGESGWSHQRLQP